MQGARNLGGTYHNITNSLARVLLTLKPGRIPVSLPAYQNFPSLQESNIQEGAEAG